MLLRNGITGIMKNICIQRVNAFRCFLTFRDIPKLYDIKMLRSYILILLTFAAIGTTSPINRELNEDAALVVVSLTTRTNIAPALTLDLERRGGLRCAMHWEELSSRAGGSKSKHVDY